MATFNLEAHIPFNHPDKLFSGSEDDLKVFINKNLRVDNKGHRRLCGYRLLDTYITIDGPEVESYIDAQPR